MFSFVPTCSVPTVTTADSVAAMLRDDRLQLHHGGCCHHDRVDGLLGCRTVRATAVHDDLQRIAGRHHGPRPEQHPPCRRRCHVLAERHIRRAESLEQPVVDHRGRTAADLLGRLHGKDDPTPPASL